MGQIGKVKMAVLNAAGEDEIFGMIAQGKKPSDVIKHFDVGWHLFHKWIAAEDGRDTRYKMARDMAGHHYASKAEEIAESIHMQEASVNSARLAVDTYRWLAAKANDQYDAKQNSVAVNVSVNDLHAQAAQLLKSVGGDVIDGDYEDAETVDDEDDVGADDVGADDVEGV